MHSYHTPLSRTVRTMALPKVKQEFEDIKGVIRIHISRTDKTIAKRKSTKGQTTIYKAHT